MGSHFPFPWAFVWFRMCGIIYIPCALPVYDERGFLNWRLHQIFFFLRVSYSQHVAQQNSELSSFWREQCILWSAARRPPLRCGRFILTPDILVPSHVCFTLTPALFLRIWSMSCNGIVENKQPGARGGVGWWNGGVGGRDWGERNPIKEKVNCQALAGQKKFFRDIREAIVAVDQRSRDKVFAMRKTDRGRWSLILGTDVR